MIGGGCWLVPGDDDNDDDDDDEVCCGHVSRVSSLEGRFLTLDDLTTLVIYVNTTPVINRPFQFGNLMLQSLSEGNSVFDVP